MATGLFRPHGGRNRLTGHEDEAETGAFATYASFVTVMGRRLREWPEGLLAGAEELRKAVRGMAAEERGTVRTRVNGDSHLGQVVA